MAEKSGRSLARIKVTDLLRLARLAARAEAELFARRPEVARRYAGRLLRRALCQGAALYYLSGEKGHQGLRCLVVLCRARDGPFPYRWHLQRDFGVPKFGRYPGDPPHHAGRHVDFPGRSLPAGLRTDPAAALRKYLATGQTATATALAAKAAALIDPKHRVGDIVWPDAGHTMSNSSAAGGETCRCITYRPIVEVCGTALRAPPIGVDAALESAEDGVLRSVNLRVVHRVSCRDMRKLGVK